MVAVEQIEIDGDIILRNLGMPAPGATWRLSREAAKVLQVELEIKLGRLPPGEEARAYEEAAREELGAIALAFQDVGKDHIDLPFSRAVRAMLRAASLLEGAVERARATLDEAPEINPVNYTHEEVLAINTALIDARALLDG